MKNITLKIDDETYRKARLKAAEHGTSVSAVVREFLSEFARRSEKDAHAKRIASLRKLYAEADARATSRDQPFVPSTRDEIYAERLR